MVAAFRRDTAAARALIGAGADVNLLENDSYDAITIAAALGNAQIVRLALAAGGYARAVTGPYGGSALIAAAQLGHLEAVELLIAAKASLDHVDNLGRTALIGAITLGNGDSRYQSIVEALAKAGADVNRADGNGVSPLSLALAHGYGAMAEALQRAGARP
jgi:ankyrin repeat protein